MFLLVEASHLNSTQPACRQVRSQLCCLLLVQSSILLVRQTLALVPASADHREGNLTGYPVEYSGRTSTRLCKRLVIGLKFVQEVGCFAHLSSPIRNHAVCSPADVFKRTPLAVSSEYFELSWLVVSRYFIQGV